MEGGKDTILRCSLDRFSSYFDFSTMYTVRTQYALLEEFLGGEEFAINLLASPTTPRGVQVTDIWLYHKINDVDRGCSSPAERQALGIFSCIRVCQLLPKSKRTAVEDGGRKTASG